MNWIKKYINYNYLSYYFIIFIFLLGCNKNPLKVDISDIKVDIEMERFDQDLFAIDTIRLREEINHLSKVYHPFFENYSNHIMNLGNIREKEFVNRIKSFLNDSLMNELYDSCQYVFSNISSLNKKINRAFRYYQYYFPDKEIPRILMHISGFNQSIVIDKGIISVSIDKYLGSQNVFYKRLGFYNYMKTKMHPAQIPFDIFLSIGFSDIPFGELNTLLDNIVYQGKVYYFLQAMFPDASENKILGYKITQQEWCESNEPEMWRYLVEKKHLFNTNQRTINQYIEDGPFTKGFPDGSPAKTGVWIGLQIIKSYVKNNDVTLNEILEDVDYEKILRKSLYNP